jgi:hypothetical protein
MEDGPRHRWHREFRLAASWQRSTNKKERRWRRPTWHETFTVVFLSTAYQKQQQKGRPTRIYVEKGIKSALPNPRDPPGIREKEKKGFVDEWEKESRAVLYAQQFDDDKAKPKHACSAVLRYSSNYTRYEQMGYTAISIHP